MENLIEKKGILYLLRQSNFSRFLVGIAFFLSIVGTIASLMLPLIVRNVIDGIPFIYVSVDKSVVQYFFFF